MSRFKTWLSVDCMRCGKPVYFRELHYWHGQVADTVSGVRLQYALRICEFYESGEVACDMYEGEDAGLVGCFPLCDNCMKELDNWLFKGGKLKFFEEVH